MRFGIGRYSCVQSVRDLAYQFYSTKERNSQVTPVKSEDISKYKARNADNIHRYAKNETSYSYI